jgi:hypothetical protein
LPVVQQQDGAAEDHQDKGDECPGLEMQAEDVVAVGARPRDDVQEDLTHRDGGAGRRSMVMA